MLNGWSGGQEAVTIPVLVAREPVVSVLVKISLGLRCSRSLFAADEGIRRGGVVPPPLGPSHHSLALPKSPRKKHHAEERITVCGAHLPGTQDRGLIPWSALEAAENSG